LTKNSKKQLTLSLNPDQALQQLVSAAILPGIRIGLQWYEEVPEAACLGFCLEAVQARMRLPILTFLIEKT
jgi:hypothetical protein